MGRFSVRRPHFQDPLLLVFLVGGSGQTLRWPHEKSKQRGDPYQHFFMPILRANPPDPQQKPGKRGVGVKIKPKSAVSPPPKTGPLGKNGGPGGGGPDEGGVLPASGLFRGRRPTLFNRCAGILEIYGPHRNHIFFRAPVFPEMLVLEPQ